MGFRYNALFTLGATVSTRGSSYARALQQLTTGVYLAEVCLIGLFAIGIGNTNQAIGPLVLMIIFLVATVAWHIWLNRSLAKMEADLPSEASITPQIQNGEYADVEKAPGADGVSHGHGNTVSEAPAPTKETSTPTEKLTPKQRVTSFFSPAAAAESIVQRLMPNLTSPARAYTDKEHDEAFIHPAIISETPIVWIAKDKYGVSKQEVAASRSEVGEGLEITDEGAWFDEKGKIDFTHEDRGSIESLPIYEDEPVY